MSSGLEKSDGYLDKNMAPQQLESITPPLKMTRRLEVAWLVCPPVHITDGSIMYGIQIDNSCKHDTCGVGVEKVFALDLKTNTSLWIYPLEDKFCYYTGVRVADGIVYFGAASPSKTRCYALNASTGTVIWSYDTVQDPNLETPSFSFPTVAEGIITYGIQQGDFGYLYALNATTGTFMWRFPISVDGSPTIYNGKVYALSEGELYILDAQNGWLEQFFGEFPESFNITKDIVYINIAGRFYALDPKNETKIWRLPYSTLTEKNGLVFALYGNKLCAFNRTTGVSIWQSEISWDVGEAFSFIVANEVIYVNTRSQRCYWNPYVGEMVCNYHILAFNISTGEMLWYYPSFILERDTGGTLDTVLLNRTLYIIRFHGVNFPNARGCAFDLGRRAEILVFEESDGWWTDKYSRFYASSFTESINGWERIRILWSNAPITVMTNSTVYRTGLDRETGNLVMEVAGIHGTVGFMNITVPRDFALLASDIKIYLNQKPLNFNFTRYDSYSLVTLKYNHSIHEISVFFPIWRGREPPKLTIPITPPREPNYALYITIIAGVMGVTISLAIVFIRRRKKTLILTLDEKTDVTT